MPFKKVISKQLGELLIERGVITQQQLENALVLQRQDKSLLIGEILVKLGYAKEEDIARILSIQYGFPYLPLGNYEVDPEVIKIIPARLARQYTFIPIDKIANSLTVVMANPLDLKAIEKIEVVTACNVQLFISTSSDIKEAIKKYYKDI